MSTILITGAAGRVGGFLRPRLAAPGRTLRVLDLAELTAGEGEEAVQASVTDMDAMTEACRGVDAVIHLGGQATEAPWERVLDVNINGTYTVFEAARRAGVPRVVFASSNHAVGFHTPDEYPLPEDVTTLPDTYYGVSKAAGEALGALYAKRYGLDVVCIRILTCFPSRTACGPWPPGSRPTTPASCSKPVSPRRNPATASSTASRRTPAAASSRSTGPAPSATSRRTTPRPTTTSSPRGSGRSTRPTPSSRIWAATSASRTSTPRTYEV